MSAEIDLSGVRKQLIDTCTSHQFRQKTGDLLGEGLYPVIEPEVQMAQNRRELYVLGESAQIEIPAMLEPRVAEAIHASWDKYCHQMADPDHGTTIFAESNKQPHTWMKIDTSIRLLRGGCAEIHCIEVDGVHLPLLIGLDRGLAGGRGAIVLPKEDKLDDDFFVQLVQATMSAFGEREDAGMSDKELKEKIIHDRRTREGEETLPLRLLANLPRQFCQLFDAKELSVTPGRLMTEAEAGNWESAAAGVFRATRNGGDVVVGELGYGSYERLQANIDLGTGRMMLEPRGLEANGAESSIQKRKFLAPVTDGTKAIGATVCSVA